MSLRASSQLIPSEGAAVRSRPEQYHVGGGPTRPAVRLTSRRNMRLFLDTQKSGRATRHETCLMPSESCKRAEIVHDGYYFSAALRRGRSSASGLFEACVAT